MFVYDEVCENKRGNKYQTESLKSDDQQFYQ